MNKSHVSKTKNSITKQIVFPKKLIDLAQTKIDKLGINLPEYVRYLILRDTEDMLQEMPLLDDETIAAVGRSWDDYAAGRYTVLKDAADIDEHFSKLAEEAKHE